MRYQSPQLPVALPAQQVLQGDGNTVDAGAVLPATDAVVDKFRSFFFLFVRHTNTRF